MDPVQVRETRIAPGETQVVSDTEMADVNATGTPAVRRTATVAPATAYSETRVVNPVWRRASQAIWLVVGVVDVILAFDFLFRALSANNTGFANFIYNLGGGLAAPFDGIFGNTVNNAGNGTIGIDRWGDLMAIAIYTLVGALLVQIVRISTTPKDSVSSSSTTVV